MNQSNSPVDWNNSDEWKSWAPEVFLANLLHELRTPVMIIKGYTALLSEEQDQKHLQEALDSISKSLERIEKACQSIAEYRRALEKKPNAQELE